MDAVTGHNYVAKLSDANIQTSRVAFRPISTNIPSAGRKVKGGHKSPVVSCPLSTTAEESESSFWGLVCGSKRASRAFYLPYLPRWLAVGLQSCTEEEGLKQGAELTCDIACTCLPSAWLL